MIELGKDYRRKERQLKNGREDGPSHLRGEADNSIRVLEYSL